MNYVHTEGLHKLFTDNTFTEFTSDAKASGVTPDSIIYITCLSDTQFGEEFKDGETFIWAKGNFYGGPSITDSYIKSLFQDYSSKDDKIMTYEEINTIVNNLIKV